VNIFNRHRNCAREGELQLPPIAGAQQPVSVEHTILVKVIDDSCCQIECVEPLLTAVPPAASIILCEVVNIQTVATSISSTGVVSVRISYDVVVVYLDALGVVHTVKTTFHFPPDNEPPKLVSLSDGTVSDQVIVEAAAAVDTCMIEQAGTIIHCVVFLDICIKIGHMQQLIILAKKAPRPPKCEVVSGNCPPPNGDPPSRIANR